MAGRARAVVVRVGTQTAMGGIRDSMLQTEDVSTVNSVSLSNFSLHICTETCCLAFNFLVQELWIFL